MSDVLKGRRDRARLDHLAARAKEHHDLALTTPDPARRAYHEGKARYWESMLRRETAWPIGIWLWGMKMLAVLLP